MAILSGWLNHLSVFSNLVSSDKKKAATKARTYLPRLVELENRLCPSALQPLSASADASIANASVTGSVAGTASISSSRSNSVPQKAAVPLQGSFAIWNVSNSLTGVAFAPGIVGVLLDANWDKIQTGLNNFDWSTIDARIQEATAANLKVSLNLIDSPTRTPGFIQSDPNIQKITLMDTNPQHSTFGQQLTAPVFWDPTFNAAREAYLTAAGARYASNPAVVAVNVGFANWYTGDWLFPHRIGNYAGTFINEDQQWLDAGYTTAKMFTIGQQIIDTTAAAFPNQALKLPIGVDDTTLDGSDTALATAIVNYGYSQYGSRFYAQINSLSTTTPTSNNTSASTASLFQILYAHSPHIGLQLLGAASLGGLSTGGSSATAQLDLNASLTIASSYAGAYLEFWNVDARNPALSNIIPGSGAKSSNPPPNSNAHPPITTHLLAVGADAGGVPEVKVFNPTTGALVSDFMAYDSHFQGGVRVAVADMNGDGIPDIITAPGPTGGPDIRVFDGSTGKLIQEFMAYDPGFTGGIFVAAGDVNGDGTPDIITSPDAMGGPDVRVFDGKTGAKIAEFMAYDHRFLGGVRVTAADVNGDGKAEIITSPGIGGGPDIRIFNAATGAILQEYSGLSSSYSGGGYVTAADINGDGKADIIVASGAGGTPQVNIFSGADGSILHSLTSYEATFVGGVHIAAADVNGDGKAEVVAASGPGSGHQVDVFNGADWTSLDSFFAFDANYSHGMFVGVE